MAQSVATLLEQRGGGTLRLVALVALVAAVGFWIADSTIGTVISDRTFVEELTRPTPRAIWIRALVVPVVVLLVLGRRSRARLHLLSSALDAAPDGIQIADLEGRIAYSNRAVTEIYGFAPEELQGKLVNDMNVDPTFASEVILPALGREGRWTGELDVKHKEGRSFPIWLTTSVIDGAGGRPIAAVGVIRDISERKRIEQELRRYAHRLEEATRLKDLFADILRHDLLGPASALQLSIEKLSRGHHDETSTRLLANASRSCRKLTELIEAAAAYAKLSDTHEIQFGPLDLGEVLRGVIGDVEASRAERRARIVFEPAGRYPAQANPMIAQAFENLLSNALKYGPAEGTIAIEVRDLGDRWRVAVADRGEGIPGEDKEKVFTRFERLRKEGVKGTGVGLAIAKRIVELHHGRIWVEDNPGGGSVFVVSLPKRDGAPAAPE